jgi:hypothetical protein
MGGQRALEIARQVGVGIAGAAITNALGRLTQGERRKRRATRPDRGAAQITYDFSGGKPLKPTVE